MILLIPTSATAREVTIDAYIDLLKSAAEVAPEESPALSTLRSINSVATNQGVLAVENSWMSAGTPTLKPRLETALHEAEAVRSSAQTPPTQGGTTPEDEARRITETPEFHPSETLLDRIRRAIGEAFGQRKPRAIDPKTRLPQPPSALDTIVQVFVYLLLAGIVAVIAYLIWKRMRGGVDDQERDDSEEIWGIGPADPDQLMKMANTAAAELRFSDAVRALYLANLIRLDKKGIIHFDPAATNGQFRRRLAAAFGRAVPPFDGATLTFERVHYGGEAAGESDWDATQSQWRDVWTGVST